VVHPASVRDRDGLARVLDRPTRRRFPFFEVVFADQGHQGPKTAAAAARSGSRPCAGMPGRKGFAVLPRRRVVERTLSWLRRNRRLAKVSSISLDPPKPLSASP
jgi:transposase